MTRSISLLSTQTQTSLLPQVEILQKLFPQKSKVGAWLQISIDTLHYSTLLYITLHISTLLYTSLDISTLLYQQIYRETVFFSAISCHCQLLQSHPDIIGKEGERRKKTAILCHLSSYHFIYHRQNL